MDKFKSLMQPVRDCWHRRRTRKGRRNTRNGDGSAQRDNKDGPVIPEILEPPVQPGSSLSRLHSPKRTSGDSSWISYGAGSSPQTHSRRSSVREIGPDGWLEEELRKKRIEMSFGSQAFFVPRDAQEDLITEPVVNQSILRRHPGVGASEARRCAEETCRCARQLFATLAGVGMAGDIYFFLKEGVSDKDLPLKRVPAEQGRFLLGRKRTKQPIAAMKTWNDKELEEFERTQWWMTAPFFKHLKHHELDDNAILPFIPFDPEEIVPETKEGGFSEVYPARLHSAHHNFWKQTVPEDQGPLVAIKKLISTDSDDFQKEQDILVALGAREHTNTHLIKLLATYRHKKKYHLIFHYADADLKQYWENRLLPSFDKETVIWTLKQMTGIAGALHRLHNFAPSDTPSLPSNGNPKSHAINEEPQLPHGKGKYGRHGDVKPENILWFKNIPGSNYGENGILLVADFGLCRLHGRKSRSNQPAHSVVASPTYKPPESKLGKDISRAYDIWSLGGLYVEFITWILMGWEAIGSFADARGLLSEHPEIEDDYFFTVIKSSDSYPAKVRDSVVTWINELHQHERCSELIHDLLDLITKQLLVADPNARIKASTLCQELNKLVEKSERDTDYLLHPIPRSTDTNNNNEILDEPAWQVAGQRRMKVSVSSKQRVDTPRMFQPQPKDLVGRADGTPGRHSKSWPISESQ